MMMQTSTSGGDVSPAQEAHEPESDSELGHHVWTVSLGILDRERFAVLALSGLILGGGFFPQPGVTTRDRAAALILAERERRTGSKTKGIETESPTGIQVREAPPAAGGLVASRVTTGL
jgi:hypothetical protein